MTGEWFFVLSGAALLLGLPIGFFPFRSTPAAKALHARWLNACRGTSAFRLHPTLILFTAMIAPRSTVGLIAGRIDGFSWVKRAQAWIVGVSLVVFFVSPLFGFLLGIVDPVPMSRVHGRRRLAYYLANAICPQCPDGLLAAILMLTFWLGFIAFLVSWFLITLPKKG